MIPFLIIGGGIAGLSAAARLSVLGPVTLLEAEPHLGHHASGRSAALFEETYGTPEVVALNLASRAELEARGVLSPRGLLMVARPEDETAFDADLAGMEMAEVSVADAVARCPVLDAAVLTRAAWHEAAFDIDTDRLLQGFRREAQANGAELRTGTGVTAIDRTASGWRVTAATGVIEARRIVNAAGAWADTVAVMAGLPPLGLTPLRRSMARVPSPLDPSAWPMVMGAGEAWYMKPDAGALLISPAEEDPVDPHDAFTDDLVLAEGIARFEGHATMRVTRLLSSWAGLRTFAPDRRLVLGPDPLDETFLWCAGQGGYGFQTACAASALLADLATGRSPILGNRLASALSPARLRQTVPTPGASQESR